MIKPDQFKTKLCWMLGRLLKREFLLEEKSQQTCELACEEERGSPPITTVDAKLRFSTMEELEEAERVLKAPESTWPKSTWELHLHVDLANVPANEPNPVVMRERDGTKLTFGGVGLMMKGVTGVVGPPDENLEAAIKREHCASNIESTDDFKTGNYKISTKPRDECTRCAQTYRPSRGKQTSRDVGKGQL